MLITGGGGVITDLLTLLNLLLIIYVQEYIIIEKEGEYPTSLWACVTTLYGDHDLYNDIHRLEASVLAVCGHVAKPHVL